MPSGQFLDLLHDNAALEAGVERDLLQRSADSGAHNIGADSLLIGEAHGVDLGASGHHRLDQGHATAGHDALLDGRLCIAHGVLDAVFALLELDLCCRTDLDDGDAASQLGEALLELFAIVIGIRLLDLRTNLVDPTRDLIWITGSLDDGRLVLGDDHLACSAEQLQAGALQFEANLFRDDLGTGEDRDVLQHRLAAIAEARSLDRHGAEGATNLVDHQGRQGFALDVLGDDREWLA